MIFRASVKAELASLFEAREAQREYAGDTQRFYFLLQGTMRTRRNTGEVFAIEAGRDFRVDESGVERRRFFIAYFLNRVYRAD